MDYTNINTTTTIMLDRHTIRIPMKLKKRRGRKEIIVPDGLDQCVAKPDCDMPFVIALARAHAWQELLDSGKYKSIRVMAKDLGICNTYMARLLRFTILAPDIIESILDGRELTIYHRLSLSELFRRIGWYKENYGAINHGHDNQTNCSIYRLFKCQHDPLPHLVPFTKWEFLILCATRVRYQRSTTITIIQSSFETRRLH